MYYVVVVIVQRYTNVVFQVEKRSIDVLFLFILKSVKNNVILYLRGHETHIMYLQLIHNTHA